jgi:hypothetical protein
MRKETRLACFPQDAKHFSLSKAKVIFCISLSVFQDKILSV